MNQNPKLQTLSILVIGLGIGWLAGLSTSPIVASIITSLVALGAGVVAGLQVIQEKTEENTTATKKKYIDARPVALLILGIALAAPCGILARTYHIFEPTQVISKQTDTKNSSQNQGVLFGNSESECNQILSLATMGNYKEFIEELKVSSIPHSEEMVKKFESEPKTLEFFLRIICQNHNKS